MNHYFQQATFARSAAGSSSLPPESGIEVAFAGRSNSGKSSTINKVCSQKSLARTSKTPGRTQLINFFALPDANYLVDLPGYGYAKVPLNVKMQWQQFIEAYLSTRSSLKGLILVMDIRHPLTEFDSILLNWAAYRQLAVHVLLNKTDKISRGAAGNTLLQVRKDLKQHGEQVTVQLFSAETGQGLEDIWAVLERWLGQAEKE
ncbi:ribosome biogenesis GTP-binding protein YihA/YsxC [Thiolinea disciformis]|uniref:ribosome biogenesis GTP-binding protein YihA/YsxC n=1 Tax=Thiolinea disciformis TaxID=125614 RepID=UPI0003622946|nr:ribosome biogenesis GTP-binding protein YihA/YsxC [Thiolinea disciformis]